MALFGPKTVYKGVYNDLENAQIFLNIWLLWKAVDSCLREHIQKSEKQQLFVGPFWMVFGAHDIHLQDPQPLSCFAQALSDPTSYAKLSSTRTEGGFNPCVLLAGTLVPPQTPKGQGCPYEPQNFLLRAAPKDHQPPTANRQRPTVHGQPPPTANHQPPLATNRHPRPTATNR